MFTKKKLFFYIFYTLLFSIFSQYFIYFFNKGTDIISINSFLNLSKNLSSILILYLILVFLISFIFSIKDYFKKKDFILIITISLIISFLLKMINSFNSFDIFIILFFYLIILISIIYLFFFKKKNIITFYFDIFFLFLILSLLLIVFIFISSFHQKLNYSEKIEEIILENNYIVLDILNNNSNKILYPYINETYYNSFYNGYFFACEKYKIKNCTLNISLENHIKSYFKEDLILFNKKLYVNAIKEKIKKDISPKFLEIILFIILTAIFITFSFLSAIFTLIVEFFTKKIVMFFSWIFDPLGIEKFYKN